MAGFGEGFSGNWRELRSALGLKSSARQRRAEYEQHLPAGPAITPHWIGSSAISHEKIKTGPITAVGMKVWMDEAAEIEERAIRAAKAAQRAKDEQELQAAVSDSLLADNPNYGSW
jgi:hypothetical protein